MASEGRLTPTLCNARDNAIVLGDACTYHVPRVIPTLIPDPEYSQNEAPGFWAPFQLLLHKTNLSSSPSKQGETFTPPRVASLTFSRKVCFNSVFHF